MHAAAGAMLVGGMNVVLCCCEMVGEMYARVAAWDECISVAGFCCLWIWELASALVKLGGMNPWSCRFDQKTEKGAMHRV